MMIMSIMIVIIIMKIIIMMIMIRNYYYGLVLHLRDSSAERSYTYT